MEHFTYLVKVKFRTIENTESNELMLVPAENYLEATKVILDIYSCDLISYEIEETDVPYPIFPITMYEEIQRCLLR
jgi:hypothetical protein